METQIKLSGTLNPEDLKIFQSLLFDLPKACPECDHSTDADTWIRAEDSQMRCSNCRLNPYSLNYKIGAVYRLGRALNLFNKLLHFVQAIELRQMLLEAPQTKNLYTEINIYTESGKKVELFDGI